MDREWIFLIIGIFAPALLGGIALIINLRIKVAVELAVMKEKLGYQAKQLSKLIALVPGEDVSDEE